MTIQKRGILILLAVVMIISTMISPAYAYETNGWHVTSTLEICAI